MATINYGFTFVPVGTANEEVTATADITLPSPSGFYTIENDTDGGAYFYANAQDIAILAVDIYTPDTTFTDGVYHLYGTYIDGPDTYDGDGYFLKTVVIDAAIAAYPTTTPIQVAIKAYLVALRVQIDDDFANLNCSICSNNILLAASIIASTSNTTDLTASLTLTTPSNIEVEVDPTSGYTSGSFYAWGNTLTNTLDGETKDFSSFQFAANDVAAQTDNVTSATMYPTRFADGVYSIGLATAELFGIPFPDGVIYTGVPSYVLVTTESDLGIALYQANYDPTNATQVANLAQLLVLQALVLSEFAANDYAGANQAIEDIFAILDDGIIWTDFSAALTDESNITITFGSLPSGTYSNGEGTLTNTMTLEEYGFTGFPVNNVDLTEILNSVTLDAGDDFPDGVYQIAGSFTVDGVLFTYSAYVLVITDIYCGYDKIVARASTCKFSASLQMKIQAEINMIINCFQRGDYVTANSHIRIATQMLSQTGCSCGCG